MKHLLMVIALLLSAVSAQAALQPFYQTQHEIEDLLNNYEAFQDFDMEYPIDSIVRNKDSYTVKAGPCSVKVKVIYIPSRASGGTQYKFKPGKTICK